LISAERTEIEQGKVLIWMQDECHQLHGDTCGKTWIKKNTQTFIPMTNFRESQTWYGALNLYTGKFFIEPAEKGNEDCTIDFLKSLIAQNKGCRHIIIWDGASYHKSKKLKAYLKELNGNLPKSEWKIRLVFFAPNAPEQNPVEDIWLQGKNYVRRNFDRLSCFAEIKAAFEGFLSKKKFNFNKIKDYLTPNPEPEFIT